MKLVGIPPLHRCATCTFSVAQDFGDLLNCHESSPQVNGVTIPKDGAPGWQIVGATMWPEVRPEQFCGKHPARQAALQRNMSKGG
jgi:hypothetical protein